MRILKFEDESSWLAALLADCLAVLSEPTDRYPVLALAGGQTPGSLYRALSERLADPIPAHPIVALAGDERFLPASQAELNGSMLHACFEDAIAAGSIKMLDWPLADTADEACSLMAARLRATLVQQKPQLGGQVVSPVFDLCLLGIGADGHTAGLFGSGPLYVEPTGWCCHCRAPQPPRERLSLSVDLLSRSRRLWFAVKAAGKAAVMSHLMERWTCADRKNHGGQAEPAFAAERLVARTYTENPACDCRLYLLEN